MDRRAELSVVPAMMGHVGEADPAVTSVLRRRFAAQLLSGASAGGSVEVAQRLVAIQAQDPRGARLAIRARTAGLTAADVDRALTDERSLVLTWLNRGTLHLVRSEDYWWLHALTTARPQLEGSCLGRLARAGVSPAEADKGVAAVERALLVDGPLTGVQLASRLTAIGLPGGDGVPLDVLFLAGQRGILVRGPVIEGRHAYVHVRDWLGPPPRPDPDPDEALAWLARRYLAGHGPAGASDLARWAGLTVGWARRGLAGIAAELAERSDGLAELAELAGVPAGQETGLPAPRLLGPFDPVLHGWVSRAAILDEHVSRIVTVNALFRAFMLVGGRAAGTWTYRDGEVTLNRFGELPADVEAALAAEASDVRRFLEGS